jgi:hypothetical protein
MTQTEEEAFQGAQNVIMVIGKLRGDLEMPCHACHEEAENCPYIQCGGDRQITICQAKQICNYLWATIEFLSGRKITFGEKTAFAKELDGEAKNNVQ